MMIIKLFSECSIFGNVDDVHVAGDGVAAPTTSAAATSPTATTLHHHSYNSPTSKPNGIQGIITEEEGAIQLTSLY
jgi:hypothetical protein